MGEVYRAKDKKLDRDVAIKVLPESVAADPETLARFEREAKAVAALSHPNILSIFHFGTYDGISYAVMELLEGETLRGKLDAGSISQKQAVDYALQVVKGLSAAHEKGIIHRDLKPENLFVTKDGQLKILDFGLAKRVVTVAPSEETSAPTVSGHTMPGTVMGTLGYMSPEQVKGLAVDHRSDIFSFGAVLYEMLSGQRAFARPTASETIAAILKEEPAELSESGRSVSPALDHIVRHCLEKDRDHRFQSARDIAFALSEATGPMTTSGAQLAAPQTGKLKLLIAAAVIVILAVAGAFVLRRSGRDAGEAGRVKRVAVLPFENLGSPEDDYFADGIADAVRGKLTSLRGLEVIARGSSIPYKKTTKTPKQIAEELDAPYLLMATVRWQKSRGTSRVQVSPELVQVKSSGAPASRWQQPFDAALTDVFQVQSDIASRVAQALDVALGAGEEKRLAEKPTQNLAAYDAFLKSEEIWQPSGGWDISFSRVIPLYEQAVALDPGFAQAWARLSQARSHLYYGYPTPVLKEQAHAAASKTEALASNAPETYLAVGEYQYWVLQDARAALEQIDKGQRLAPGNAELLRSRSIMENVLGRRREAEVHIRQAARLDPRSVPAKMDLAGVFSLQRQYSEARKLLDQALTFAPTSLDVIEEKAMTFLGEGDLAGARATIRAAPKEVEPTALVAHIANINDLVWVLDEEQREVLVRLTPSAFESEQEWALCLAQAYALKDDAGNLRLYSDEARKRLEEHLRAAPTDPQSHAYLGIVLAYLGRKEEAIREGQRAVALRPAATGSSESPFYLHQLVRIYTLVGDPEKAVDNLESLLKMPYFLSPGWLKIDPNFDPLRKNPRFQKLVASAK